MRADDERHSSVAGYRAGCREICCKKAISRYNEQRKARAFNGRPTSQLVPALGTQRRLQALGALGWSISRISDRAQIDPTYLRFVLRNNQRVSANLAYAIKTTYDALCMTLPPATNARERQGVTRTLKRAAELGWAPPLAWDDIDADRSHVDNYLKTATDKEVDHVLVDRILNGDMTSASSATPAERLEVHRRWISASTRSTADLERATGWNVHRDVRMAAA